MVSKTHPEDKAYIDSTLGQAMQNAPCISRGVMLYFSKANCSPRMENIFSTYKAEVPFHLFLDLF